MCPKCSNPLVSSAVGRICIECGHMEDSEQTQDSPEPAPATLTLPPPATPPPPPLEEAAVIHKTLIRGKFIVSLAAVLVVSGLAVGATLLFQNQAAKSLLAISITSAKQAKLDESLTDLKKADALWTLPSTQQHIDSQYKQLGQWQEDLYRLQLAESYLTKSDYTRALSTLKKISANSPLKAKVVADTATANALATTQAAASTSTSTTTRKTSPSTKTTPATSNLLRYGNTAATTSLRSATTLAQAQAALQQFGNQYHLTIQIAPFTPSSYVKNFDTFSYLSESDVPNLKNLGLAFIDEWAKYPFDFVAASQNKNIAFVKDLAVGGQYRAATPDPFGQTMYYDTNLSQDMNYMRLVIHHEYNHFIIFNKYGSYNPSDPTWTAQNPNGFSYYGSGSQAYGNTAGPNPYTLHPLSGFVTGYAEYAIEEDKAETYAYIMTTTPYKNLKSWIASDPKLAQKVAQVKQMMSSMSPAMSGSYFDSINGY